MSQIEELIQSFSEEYARKKSKLRALKLGAAATAFFGFCYGSLAIFGKGTKYHFNITEILEMDLLLFLLIMIPVLTAPLYIFMDDKIQQGIRIKIKKAIFYTTLDQYDLAYELYPNHELPDQDIERLGFEKKTLQFAFGDDLIQGQVNDHIKFRISELHSRTIWRVKFDGLVGILIYSKSESEQQQLKFEDLSSKLSSDIEVRSISNKLYLLMKGDKRHFEFTFRHEKGNIEQLHRDKQLFEKLCKYLFTS
jgi:hypothetical protein